MKYQLAVFFLFFSFYSQAGIGQVSENQVVAPDSDFHNGEIYNFSNLNIEGNQYLEQVEFLPGSLTLGNKKKDGFFINYDIYNQEILVKSAKDEALILSVPKEIITNFSMGEKDFRVMRENEWRYIIYEEIGHNDLVLLKKWSKQVEIARTGESKDYKFSKAKSTLFLYKNSTFTRINRRRDFTNAFDAIKRELIVIYLRKNRLSLKKASNMELKKLIEYTNSL